MKWIFLLLFPLTGLSQTSMKQYPVYTKNDLGVTYTPAQTSFKVWAPTAEAVRLLLYKTGGGGAPFQTIMLAKGAQGSWQAIVKADIKNSFYTFRVQVGGNWLEETPDIYARCVGVNGKRGMVIDMAETDPPGWKNDKKPPLKHFTDIVIYESHVRDFSIAKNSGIAHKGKFAGITEKNTRNEAGQSTGLDHLKELGITHIHLLPAFDFNSIDESDTATVAYNWGYDPLNYNVPEGSYSSNAADGRIRIKEFKQLVQSLHASGIRVILDVVYNHTANRESAFNRFVPGYFYRFNADGSYSDASACGNETASEKPMMRKFMIESVAYWAREYHIDGFRFDLMGVHDIATMNAISSTLHQIDPTIFLYGEGWAVGSSPLPENERAVKKNTYRLQQIAAFSDDIRDALRGPFDKVREKGFVSGEKGKTESLKFGIAGSTRHPQVDYSKVAYSNAPWAAGPSQTINYASCHDDNTLFDRLAIANPGATEADLIKMDRLAQTIVFTSQGVPFLHSGAELLRTKKGVANSYNAPDSINEIDWTRKTTYKDVFNYYKALISLRKNHPAFRMPTTAMIQKHLRFTDMNDPLLVAYQLNDHANGDPWKDILVILNGDTVGKQVALPKGSWTIAADGLTVTEKGSKTVSVSLMIPATSAFILYRN